MKFLVIFFIGVFLISKSSSEKCEINSRNLIALRNSLAAEIGESDIGDEVYRGRVNCTAIVIKNINFSSRLRNILIKKLEDLDLKLRAMEEGNKGDLDDQRTSLSNAKDIQVYEKLLKSAAREMREIRKNIKKAVEEKDALDQKLRFFKLEMTPGAASDMTCPLDDDLGKTLIRILGELYAQTVRESYKHDCGTLIRTMSNVHDFVALRNSGDKRAVDLLQRESDDWKVLFEQIKEHIEQESRDYNSLTVSFVRVRGLLDEIKKKVEELQAQVPESAYNFCVRMINGGIYFWEAREALEDADFFKENAFNEILSEAYNCKSENLPNVIKFATYVNRSGVEHVRDKMEECGHLEDKNFLKVAHILKDDELQESVDNVYVKFAEKIRQNDLDEVLQATKDFNKDVLDVEKLIVAAYGGSNVNYMNVTKFIDQLGVPNQNYEKVLYDEMIQSRHADKPEHLMFAFWLGQRMAAYERLPNVQDRDIIQQKANLEEIKNRLPEGIKNLFFETGFMLASTKFNYDGFSRMLRVPGSNSQRFKAIPSNGGRYFKIRDYYEEKFLTVEKPDKRRNLHVLKSAVVRNSNFNSFYWQIIPTRNATEFFIKNFDRKYISVDDFDNCTDWKYDWWKVRYVCSRSETLNYVKSQGKWNEKWKITTYISRQNQPTGRGYEPSPY